MAEKPRKMSDAELVSLVNSDFDSAMGAPGGEIALERAKAWDYYLSKPLGNEVEGQSSVVSSDVSDVVDGVMPSLLRIFTIADNLVSFDPVGPEDVEKAEQESDYVNYVFFKQNPAFLILYSWFFDALIQKNGIVKAWWDKTETVTQESYTGLSELELAELMDDDELEVLEHEEREGITAEDVPVPLAPGQETTVQMIGPGTVHDVTFRRVSTRGRPRVANVAPEQYRISSDSQSLDPSDARMVGQESEIKRSDLLDMDFDPEIVRKLPAIKDQDQRTDESLARYDTTDDTREGKRDKSQDKILVREAYIKVDRDGDGHSELRQVFVSGSELLSDEIADRQPFHVISPQPLPHKHFGRATAEKVMDVQRVNTTLTRQILDNLYHSNQPSHAVWEQGIGENTLDDLLTTRVGSVKRFARPVSESWAPISIPYTAAQTFPMLQWWDKVKRDRTGITADGEGLSPEALKNIQTSVLSQASDLSRMKIEAVARIFAETGIKSLFLHIHELLMKHQQKEQVVKLRNEWVQVNPQEWRTRLDMTVNIGLGIGTRHENLIHLNAIVDRQDRIASLGGYGTLVTPMNVYNSHAEIVKNANLKNPEMFFTPTDEIQPPNDQQAQLQQQQQELQARQQELDAERQQIASAKLQLQAQKDQIEAEKSRLKLELDAAELERKREADKDRFAVEMENIRNKLTELDLKYREVSIPGSRVNG